MPGHFSSERVNPEHAHPVSVLQLPLHLLDSFHIPIVKNELTTTVDWVSMG